MGNPVLAITRAIRGQAPLEQFQSQHTGYFSGMKAYSDDLRERVAAACATPGRSLPQVAAQFAVSLSFVEKLQQRQRTSGSVAALPHRASRQMVAPHS